jgi:hypothetical protein
VVEVYESARYGGSQQFTRSRRILSVGFTWSRSCSAPPSASAPSWLPAPRSPLIECRERCVVHMPAYDFDVLGCLRAFQHAPFLGAVAELKGPSVAENGCMAAMHFRFLRDKPDRLSAIVITVNGMRTISMGRWISWERLFSYESAWRPHLGDVALTA